MAGGSPGEYLKEGHSEKLVVNCGRRMLFLRGSGTKIYGGKKTQRTKKPLSADLGNLNPTKKVKRHWQDSNLRGINPIDF